MRANEAIRVLSELESTNELQKEDAFLEWQSKVAGVLRSTFGTASPHVSRFSAQTTVTSDGYTSGSKMKDRDRFRLAAASRGKAEIRSSIFILDTLHHDSPLDDASIDPELWAHVQGLIADDDWAKVPAAVAIFVEDKVRSWAGDPRNSKDEVLVGKGLYTQVLNSSGMLRMGGQQSEIEGWMTLGSGLAQAIGNVDRHRIQQRSDVRRYAMGVLGLGSLLLTQLRYEHPARVQEAEAQAQAKTTGAAEE
ncbi:TIGR02391 family protein [Streptomyces phaeochromogenes]|uniref:TIGR02391 family protein n=1 Tax=Streptomyces phaeochromogenes TaxID=1923 RepID=UPI003868D4D0|nr:TIGR02391 family protein [Streptomyces phaeochromogenes]